jgi:hypothetical protein
MQVGFEPNGRALARGRQKATFERSSRSGLRIPPSPPYTPTRPGLEGWGLRAVGALDRKRTIRKIQSFATSSRIRGRARKASATRLEDKQRSVLGTTSCETDISAQQTPQKAEAWLPPAYADPPGKSHYQPAAQKRARTPLRLIDDWPAGPPGDGGGPAPTREAAAAGRLSSMLPPRATPSWLVGNSVFLVGRAGTGLCPVWH